MGHLPKAHDILLFVLVLTLAGVGWNLQAQLQQAQFENQQLREMVSKQAVCPNVDVEVQVACSCPSHDDLGELPEATLEIACVEDLSLEEIKAFCEELEEYGYIPDC